MDRLAEGLWRWTNPHPRWTPDAGGPGGWARDVASVALDQPGRPLLLIDPLFNEDGETRWLDGRELQILHGCSYHARSTPELVERGARVLPPTAPPAGVLALPIEGLGGDETAYYLVAHRALVVADAVLGAGDGKVRLAPPSWSHDQPCYAERFRASIARLLDRPIELLLTSHGPPVLRDGRAALAEALEAPPWGQWDPAA